MQGKHGCMLQIEFVNGFPSSLQQLSLECCMLFILHYCCHPCGCHLAALLQREIAS